MQLSGIFVNDCTVNIESVALAYGLVRLGFFYFKTLYFNCTALSPISLDSISSKFKSEEEEMAYWANIKVRDDGGGSGY